MNNGALIVGVDLHNETNKPALGIKNRIPAPVPNTALTNMLYQDLYYKTEQRRKRYSSGTTIMISGAR